MTLTELLKTDIHEHEMQREKLLCCNSGFKISKFSLASNTYFNFWKKRHHQVHHRTGVDNLLNAVCQFTNNIKMSATSRAKHFYVFGMHSQLSDLNSKRIRGKFNKCYWTRSNTVKRVAFQ